MVYAEQPGGATGVVQGHRADNGRIARVTCVLLVLAALAVMVVVSLPLFRGVDEGSGRKAVCQSNLKWLAMSLVMYWEDYDTTLPSSFLYGRSKTWNEKDFTRFAKERGTLPAASRARAYSWPMLFYFYMKNKDIIWCPSDPGRSDDPSARVSYYWKAAVDAAWYGGPKGTGPKCQKEGDFDFPADQIIFYEHNGWHWGDAAKGLVDGVTINCAFLDGHVQVKRIRESGYTAAENPPEPLPKSGVGEPAWFNYKFGSRAPQFSKDQNWNPKVWGDNLP